MNEIKMIPIGDLEHHPENPRKNLGDLTELAQSIRENGVMQNLTVVADPEKAKYLVVIGNRRLEAAKLAGLADLPCVISDMDHRTQVATMLMENMQRQDLTLYEQAQGFQMMMDLGFTPREIGEKTGFSETTVNRRLKMAELNQKTFEKAVGQQITMDDLDRLGQIRDVRIRNELLKKFGTDEYKWCVLTAIRKQKADEVRDKATEQLLAAKVERLPDGCRYDYHYQKLYNNQVRLWEWDGKGDIIPKVDGKLYFDMDEMTIEFLVKEKKKQAEPVRKSPEELDAEKRIALDWKTAERITETAADLRRAYAMEMKVSPKNAMEMLQWALIAALAGMYDYDTPSNQLRKEIPLKSYNTAEELEQIRTYILEMHQNQWPALILKFFHGDKAPDKFGYVDGARWQKPKWKENKKLDLCYEWLTRFGYKMSKEETEMMSGTHRIFQERMEEAG